MAQISHLYFGACFSAHGNSKDIGCCYKWVVLTTSNIQQYAMRGAWSPAYSAIFLCLSFLLLFFSIYWLFFFACSLAVTQEGGSQMNSALWQFLFWMITLKLSLCLKKLKLCTFWKETELHSLLSEMKKEMGVAIHRSPCIKIPQHRCDPTQSLIELWLVENVKVVLNKISYRFFNRWMPLVWEFFYITPDV